MTDLIGSIGTVTDHRASANRPRETRGLLRSLRARLVLCIILVDCLAAVLTAGAVIWQARTATLLELQSALGVSETAVSDTIRTLQDAPVSILLRSVRLHFQSVRHVSIEVRDGDGALVGADNAGRARSQFDRTGGAPYWFRWLIEPPIETKEYPIIVRHERVGTVTITTEAGDEVGEAWHYARVLLTTSLMLNLAVLLAIIPLFGAALRPLTDLVRGLKDLEGQRYAVRLPRSSMTELAVLTDHFNQTAASLSSAQDANRRLNLKLLSAQDDERRRTARELHDEVGPCLFALDINAHSISSLAAAEGASVGLRARTETIVELVEKTKLANRCVLDRLRPTMLARTSLSQSLRCAAIELQQSDGPPIDIAVDELRESYGPLVDLTLYRCVQEGLLNAIRHARATRISLSVREEASTEGRKLALSIEDDGAGLIYPGTQGRGLLGIEERVTALGGTFDVNSRASGTRLTIALSLDETLLGCLEEAEKGLA